jgi:hypothetical protein
VNELLGWKAQPGKVRVGFRSDTGGEMAMVLTVEQAERTIATIAAAVERAKLLAGRNPTKQLSYEFAMKVSAASFGHTPSTDEVFARMHLASGGSLGFTMPKEIASGLGRGLIETAQQPAPSLKSVLN